MGSGAFGNTGISGGSATDATITFSDITTGDVSTSKHGFALELVIACAGLELFSMTDTFFRIQ